MAPRQEVDPYAPPPMHHDRSGALVRVALIALMLGGGWLGWSYYSSNHQSAGLVGEERQVADAGSTTQSDTYVTPQAVEPAATAPQASPARSPAPRRSSASTRAAPPVPPPTTTVEPVTPAPPPAVTPIPPDTSTTGE